LVQRSRAGGGQSGSDDHVQERDKIDRAAPAGVKANRGGDEDEKGKTRLHQMGEIGHGPAAFQRHRGRFDHGGLHEAVASASWNREGAPVDSFAAERR
jgi:hypothetical protein